MCVKTASRGGNGDHFGVFLGHFEVVLVHFGAIVGTKMTPKSVLGHFGGPMAPPRGFLRAQGCNLDRFGGNFGVIFGTRWSPKWRPNQCRTNTDFLCDGFCYILAGLGVCFWSNL